MTHKLREYQRAHQGTRFPLVWLRAHLESGGKLEGAELGELSEALGLPPSALRAVAGYYADLISETPHFRVCHGTSCALAHTHAADESSGVQSPDARQVVKPVYCLGYCDRSPVILKADGGVVTQSEGWDDPRLSVSDTTPPPPPSIRCRAAEPIVTARIIKGDHSSLKRAKEAEVYAGLRAALARSPADVLEQMGQSGERGRGGAGYSTAAKWRQCAETGADKRYVVANGDEGDPGSYIDRVLMEMDPHSVIEGLAICAYAVGADEGIVFIRSEYPRAIAVMREAIREAREAGFLGHRVMGSSFDFDVSVFPAMGSYACGEETAMLNAIEGHRGEVTLRPPYPSVAGLFGKPTVTNNVETLVNVPWIIRRGAEAYRSLGTAESSGTKALCLNSGFERPGIVEVEFGDSLKAILETEGGGGRGGQSIAAVILGGPMGSIVKPDSWDVPVCYEAMAQERIQLGHGGIVAVPEGVDWGAMLVQGLRFMKNESCGKCVPCRVGSERALHRAEESLKHGADFHEELSRLFEVMEKGSLCAFGQLMPGPMWEMLEYVSGGRGGRPNES